VKRGEGRTDGWKDLKIEKKKGRKEGWKGGRKLRREEEGRLEEQRTEGTREVTKGREGGKKGSDGGRK
jgi:hypothetical protein